MSPLWGEAAKNAPLHFELESTNEKCEMTYGKSV